MLRDEEILWFQKARTQWLRDGDRNTSYYHTKTNIRRRRSRVKSLKNDNNLWVENDEEVKAMVNEFFKGLFREEEVERHRTAGQPHSWPLVSSEEWQQVCRAVTPEEIKAAMLSIGGLKAPGSDGFPAIFYHKNWEIIGEEVIRDVGEMWQDPGKIMKVNQTLITLISKIANPDKVSQFRPISLCNVTYKCFSKIIVQRLKGILGKLISPFQASFIPGRNIHDNIIIVNELIHSLKKKKGRRDSWLSKWIWKRRMTGLVGSL